MTEEELKKQQQEGQAAGTSPAPEDGVELNNATVPTAEQQKEAGIESNTEVQTPAPEEENHVETDPATGITEASATKMFTQSQVDEIAGKARKEGREKAIRDTFSRYGVNSEEELDDLFGNAQRFDTLQEKYDTETRAFKDAATERDTKIAELEESVALLSSGIDSARYEDAKFILKGKGLPVTVENIQSELETHPEWKKEEVVAPRSNPLPFSKKPETKITVLGNNSSDNPQPELSEHERAMKMFFGDRR